MDTNPSTSADKKSLPRFSVKSRPHKHPKATLAQDLDVDSSLDRVNLDKITITV